jgi:putative ABC transport system permease protein
MGLWIFALSGLAALVISWLTVSVQTIRAATLNPADTLR